MADFTRIMNSIKLGGKAEIEADNPVLVVFGKVRSVKPFEIGIEQKLALTEEFIAIGQYVKEYSLDLTIDGEMWHGFRTGDELILLRAQGGQKYVIIDYIKRADEDTRPAQVMQGEVISVDPIEIKVNDYLTLKGDELILCENVKDYHTYISFDNPEIKQKIVLFDKAEKESESEPLLNAIWAGDEPHQPLPDDIPAPIPTVSTDIQFKKKFYKNTLNIKDASESVPPEIELPAFHEVTIYNALNIGDIVLLTCERVTRKWFVTGYVKRFLNPATILPERVIL